MDYGTKDLQTRGALSNTEQNRVFGVAISFIIIIAAAMAIRIYVRFGIIKSVGADDILMILGTLAAFGLSAASMVVAYYGVGVQMDQIPPEDFRPMLKAVYSTRLLYVVGTMLVKMSLLTFYLRLDQRTRMRWTVFVLMFVTAAFSAASFGISTFICYPPSVFWTGELEDGWCMDSRAQQKSYDANGALNIAIDLAIYIVPIPMLWRIQLPIRQKILLTFIFGLGLVAIAASCVRFAYVRLLAHTEDMYFYLADSLNWCSIEIYLAIFCGSASAYRIFLRTYLPTLMGSTRGSNSNNNKASEDPSGGSTLRGGGVGGSSRSDRGHPYRGFGGRRSTTITGGRGGAHPFRDANTDAELGLNESEELIIQGGSPGKTEIHMRTEFRMEVLDSKNVAALADEDDEGLDSRALGESPAVSDSRRYR